MKIFFRGLAVLCALTGTAATAETAPDPATGAGVEVSANAGLVSDYRYRGISLSDRGPALQGGVDIEAPHFFAGAWGSTIADYEGAAVELDIYAGVQGGSDRLGWTAGAYAYLYPGGTEVNYVELIGSAETYIGPVTVGVEGAFAPKQANLDVSNAYVGLSASVETEGGLGLLVRGGFEDGFYRWKADWEVRGQYTRGSLTASVSYVDSNQGAPDEEGLLGGAGIVASLTLTL